MKDPVTRAVTAPLVCRDLLLKAEEPCSLCGGHTPPSEWQIAAWKAWCLARGWAVRIRVPYAETGCVFSGWLFFHI